MRILGLHLLELRGVLRVASQIHLVWGRLEAGQRYHFGIMMFLDEFVGVFLQIEKLGVSDARFIHHHCPVAEFGLISETMHKVDEQAAVSDIEQLTRIYTRILESYFEQSEAGGSVDAS